MAKKITGSELPDFYNIVLERPNDDEQGYDVLFVDAASKVPGCRARKGRVETGRGPPWLNDLLAMHTVPRNPDPLPAPCFLGIHRARSPPG